MIVVDRIEGEFAVLEVDGQTIDVPLHELPQGIAEGDILSDNGDDSATVLSPAVVERVKRLRAQDSGEMEIDI